MIRIVHHISLHITPRIPLRTLLGARLFHPSPCRYLHRPTDTIMAKRKRPSATDIDASATQEQPQSLGNAETPRPTKPPRRLSSRTATVATVNAQVADPGITNGLSALPASANGGEGKQLKSTVKARAINVKNSPNDQNDTEERAPASTDPAGAEATAGQQQQHGRKSAKRGTALASDAPASPSTDLRAQPARNKRKQTPSEHVKVDSAADDNPPVPALLQEAAPLAKDPAQVEETVGLKADPESEEGPKEEEEDEEVVKEALSRPPPVNSDILPLPWKGRLGYVLPPTCRLL